MKTEKTTVIEDFKKPLQKIRELEKEMRDAEPENYDHFADLIHEQRMIYTQMIINSIMD